MNKLYPIPIKLHVEILRQEPQCWTDGETGLRWKPSRG